MLKGGV